MILTRDEIWLGLFSAVDQYTSLRNCPAISCHFVIVLHFVDNTFHNGERKISIWGSSFKVHSAAQWSESCCPFMLHTKQKNYYSRVQRMNEGVSQREKRRCFVFWWYGSRYSCITCQMAAGWTGCGWCGDWQCCLVSVQTPHLTNTA